MSLNNKTVLISGGLGFIFGHFSVYLRRVYPDCKLIIIDKETYAADKGVIETAKPDKSYLGPSHGDVSIIAEQVISEHKPDIIICAHAESHVDNSIQNDDPFWNSNVLGVASMIRAYKKYCPDSRFIHISTDETISACKQDTEIPFYEDAPLNPTSPYAASKAAGELVVQSYIKTYGLENVVIVRPSNCYGSRQNTEKFIPTVINSVLNNRKIPVYADGLQMRDWLYVEDLCEAIERLCTAEQINHKIYHIGGNNERTNISVVKDILTLLGKDDSLIEYVEDRLAHDQRYFINSDRFRKEFNWKPAHSWVWGLGKTLSWYKSLNV